MPTTKAQAQTFTLGKASQHPPPNASQSKITTCLCVRDQRSDTSNLPMMQVQFTAWDLGGHEQVRDLWEEYYAGADAIVFMVDSADKSRLPEAKRELGDLLKHEAVEGELALHRRCTRQLQVLSRPLCTQECRS